jgi:hypothetical protein
MPTFQDGGAEVHVEYAQGVAVYRDVHALQASLLARLPGQVVFDVLRDRMAAEHRVAELVSAKLSGGRHHPSHADGCAQSLRMPAAARSGADHFLQCHHVGVNHAENGRNPFRPRTAIEAAAPMNVVSGDA